MNLSDVPAGPDGDTDPRLGSREGSRRIDKTRTIAKVINVGSVVTLVWGLFYPNPYPLVILLLACFPLIAIALVALTNGLYQIAEIRGDKRPSLWGPFLCGIILFVRSLDINILWIPLMPILTPVVILGTVLTLIVVIADAGTRGGTWAFVWLIATTYSFGFVVEANWYLDMSAAKTFQVEVLKKHSFSGKNGTTWYLLVDRWGPYPGLNDVSVPTTLYHSISPGQTVCVNFHPGFLKIPWYVVTNCH